MSNNPLSSVVDCIKDYPIIETDWRIKKWFKIDIERLNQWYESLIDQYGTWKWEYGKHNYMWKYDPNPNLEYGFQSDTAWIMLTWGNDQEGPVPWLRSIAKEEYNTNMPHDQLGARKCFFGYGLEIIKNMPIPAYDIQVAIHTPNTKLPRHQDSPEKFRFHIPIKTNEHARFIIDSIDVNLPADGWVYLVNTTYLHHTENCGTTDRIHIYGGVMTDAVMSLDLNKLETLI